MRECSETFCPIDHISIDVVELETAVQFFRDVFGMSVTRAKGPDQRPDSVWLDGGIQLVRVEEANHENGRFHHLAFQVKDTEPVIQRARQYGAVPVPGRGEHWFMLPNGLCFELKKQA